MQCIHFVGFRHDSEYLTAIKVWGKPHYIHYVHDRRMYQEIDKSKDIVIFSKHAKLKVTDIYSYDDSRYH